MNVLAYRFLLALGLSLSISVLSFSQITVDVTVESGNVSTTCTDAFSGPDVLFRINIENQGWETYPQVGFCHTALPHLQFSETYDCLNDAPANLSVCLRVLENDAFPCDVSGECQETYCEDFPMPTTAGSFTYTISLPAGLSSSGSATFTIDISGTGAPANDELCNATELGVLDFGYSFGDPNSSDYDNFCASGIGEPYPAQQWSTWYNNSGVWLAFETGPNPLPYLQIITNNDPSGLGDPVSLQIALWTSDDNTCTGNFILEDEAYDPAIWDEELLANCLEANQRYYVLIDGVADTQEQLYGYYGLGINVPDVALGEDSRCQAEALGTVPDNGSIAAGEWTNVCATSFTDPFAPFPTDQTVWFSFSPPSSGNVSIELESDPTLGIDPVDLEVAVYRSINGACTGAFSLVGSSYTAGTLGETLELSCLDPTFTYWVMVDGSAFDESGIFDLTITDLGDNTPVNNQSFVLCPGESIMVGSNTYQTTGIYTDTLPLPNGCDSIIVTDLTVLDPVVVNLTIDQESSGVGNPDGQATANPTGGLPGYTYLWSTGNTNNTETGLEGDQLYCLTVTDANGCEADTCFTMPFLTYIAPTFLGDSLECFGDSDGTIEFSGFGGNPPYSFTWMNTDNSLNGSGTLAGGATETITGLPAGDYSVALSDGVLDTTFLIIVWQPDELAISVIGQTDASCFGDCDGNLELGVAGGTPPYTTVWSNGVAGLSLTGLCAGDYSITITDANGCEAEATYSITEPLEILLTISEDQAISCFQGSDAILTANSNIPGTTFEWNDGTVGPTLSGLGEGTYSVTATTPDGCQVSESYVLQGPSAPVVVNIDQTATVECAGDATGALQAVINGPGTSFTYLWSTGANDAVLSGLVAGDYSVTITSNLGCTDEASFTVTEPEPVEFTYLSSDETCLIEGPDGSILVEQTSGGVGPYLYSIDGTNFLDTTAFGQLTSGTYMLTVQDASGCESMEPVFIGAPPPILLDLGADQSVTLGDPVNLDGYGANDNLVYTWLIPGQDFECDEPNCESISLVPTQSTSVFLLAVDTVSFCQETDSVFIEVQKDLSLYFPNAFSPNFDGINDFWTPLGGKGIETVRTLQVYDRYGSQVYQADNFLPDDPSQGWDGMVRGKAGQAGVYVFFAEVEFIDGTVEIYEGDVLLVR
jgi:gliding motility-associated-like protein